MQHKALSRRTYQVYRFPKLAHPRRKHAANDNPAPVLGVALKHVALMGSAFVLIIAVHSFF